VRSQPTAQLLGRSKLRHLPDDLRGIAEAMLREKFGDKEPEYIHKKQIDNVWSELLKARHDFASSTCERPGTVVLSPKKYSDLRASLEYSQMMQYSTAESKPTVMGMDVHVSPWVGEDIILMKPRNIGKSGYYQKMFELQHDALKYEANPMYTINREGELLLGVDFSSRKDRLVGTVVSKNKDGTARIIMDDLDA
jgi:hypothetical protein